MKFDELKELFVKDLKSNGNNLNINNKGIELLNDYNKFIDTLKEWVNEDAVVNIISVISAEDKGTQKFKDANRLDTMTNGGRTPIDKSAVSFNENDTLTEYLE